MRDTAQINFYLSATDHLLKHPDDKPSIGLLLVKKKDTFTAEYALQDLNKPIGVAEYKTKLKPCNSLLQGFGFIYRVPK